MVSRWDQHVEPALSSYNSVEQSSLEDPVALSSRTCLPQIIQKLISQSDLLWLVESNKHVYDACQHAKIHQLPYSLSNNSISSPLELIYSNVWDPAHSTVHVEKYYVSFVDAYSRFTWVYLLRHKSDVFNVFHLFQAKFEHALEKKIKNVQTNWGWGGGESVRNSIPSLTIYASLTECPVHIPTSKMVLQSTNIGI
jgi:hypothetical protein